MFREVDTKDPGAVRAEVIAIYVSLFPGSSSEFLKFAFQWAEECFSGRHSDYQAIDAKYHDFEHTLQVTLCYARLLEGYKRAQVSAALTARMFELGLLAILLHDMGYLKQRKDIQGTGAKYTLTHVSRSTEFGAKLLREKGFTES